MRKIHLYFTYLKRAMVAKLEYKKDTIIGIVGFLLSNVASLLSIYFIISNIPSLSGWNMYELGFLYGFTMLPVGLDHLFTDDLWCVAYWKVRTGELDKFYLRPVSVLFQIIAETFQPEAFGELIVGLALMIVSLIAGNLSISWNFSFVLLFLVATIFGALLITSIKIFVAALAFYLKRSGPILQIIYNFIGYTKYPIKIYPKVVRFLLSFLFPFALIISYPVETILYQSYNPYYLSLFIILFTGIFFTLSILFWNRAEKRYQSSGS